MSANILHSLSDDDLHNQFGCMNTIFHLLSSRRLDRNHKRLPPPPAQNDNHGIKSNDTTSLQQPTEKNPNNKNKDVKLKKTDSTESTTTSSSSSTCSSTFSSLDCNKQSQSEPSSIPQINITRDFSIHQPNDPLQLTRRQPVDLRDVVKDSMYREARGISIKTVNTDNAGGQTLKYMDSPRPLQQKPVNSRVSGLNESFRLLPKLKHAPWSSSERKDGFAPKDARRFSYDGRESNDAFKSTIKLKELPRLSLDSRERSMRVSATEMKSNYLLQDLKRGNGNCNNILNQQQEPGSNKRPSSVVAKLMGLEAFPDSMPNNENHPDVECDSSRIDGNKQIRIPGSPRNSSKDPVSPQLRNADSVKKPTPSSKFPIEHAPWKQLDGNKGPTPDSKSQETLTKTPNSSLSVYGEIEKRLAQLEFNKSGKDLRALKQILEAMQKTKEMLENRKDDQAINLVSQTDNNSSIDQSSKLANSRSIRSSNPAPRSPIVIMKAAKFIEKANISASSAILTESLSGIQRFRIGDSTDRRKESVNKQTTADQTPRTNHLKDPSIRLLDPVKKNTSVKTLRSAKASKSPQPTTGKNKSGKSFEHMNPRMQQKKLGLEKQFHPTTPSPDSSRTRRQPIESGSAHRKSGQKSPRLQQRDEQSSEISSNTRASSHQGDTCSLRSESNISMASYVDSEVTSTDRSDKISGTFFQQRGQKDPAARYNEDQSMAEAAKAGPEQPSPVSVLDATFYRDESPSPVKKISCAFKDDEALSSDEAEWSRMDLNHLSYSKESSFSSDNDYRKIENTQQLAQNLMHHEISIMNESAPIYDGTNPDHRYISEILFASGLLKDFEAGFMTTQLHPSGHLINPNLFHVLEQTKATTRLLNDEHKSKRITHSELIIQKAQRKLVFDAVNEILVSKIMSEGSSKQWFSSSKLANKRPRGQQLLRDLCSEVDRLQANNSNCSLDDDEDSLRSIIWEDLVHTTRYWTDYQSDISLLVLGVERLIFKDLISEIVRDEMAGLQGEPGRHCRQLFSQ